MRGLWRTWASSAARVALRVGYSSFSTPLSAAGRSRSPFLVAQKPESDTKGARNPYVMESSLAILRGNRLPRLKETNCLFVAPGVESWSDYSNKAGVGTKVGKEKLERLVAHFHEIHEFVPGIQANFLFGTSVDSAQRARSTRSRDQDRPLHRPRPR